MAHITLLYSRWSLNPHPRDAHKSLVLHFSGIIDRLSLNYELHPGPCRPARIVTELPLASVVTVAQDGSFFPWQDRPTTTEPQNIEISWFFGLHPMLPSIRKPPSQRFEGAQPRTDHPHVTSGLRNFNCGIMHFTRTGSESRIFRLRYPRVALLLGALKDLASQGVRHELDSQV